MPDIDGKRNLRLGWFCVHALFAMTLLT